MTQDFYINNNSTLPVLRMELINDGRYDFYRSDVINKALQDAVITFSMKNVDSGLWKISNVPCNLMLEDSNGCEERYLIEYQWKPRDTKEPGIYQGFFTISFNGNISESGVNFPQGKLIMPISEDLMIHIK